MSGQARPVDRGEVPDYWSFVDIAVARAGGLTPDLDPEAMRMIMGLHRVASMVVYDLESGVHRPAGWSWSGFRLLFALQVAGPQDAGSAAHLSGMSRAATSAVVKTLERDGLVSRTTDPHDGRAVLLALTAEGADRLARAFAAHHARERSWAAALSPAELAQLNALLAKLSTGVAGQDTRTRL